MAYFYDDVNPQPTKRRRGFTWASAITTVVLLGIVAMSALPTPYVIERPGGAFNVLGTDHNTEIISVIDAPSYETDGALDLLTVEILGAPNHTPTWLELFFAWLDPAQSIIPLEDIYPSNVSQTKVDQANISMFADSQQSALAVALIKLGYRLNSKLIVNSLATDAAATGKLAAGDQIVSIDSVKLTDYGMLTKAIQGSKGKALNLEVISAKGVTRSETITPKLVDGSYRIGAYVASKYEFPINVKLQLQDIGGPSGGMMFALGIYDKLTPGALTGGQIIAGTGTIDDSGTVGPIGGIREKLYSAQRAGAKWFLAPKENCNEVVGHIPAGLHVAQVENFDQALSAVQSIASGKGAALAGCSTTK